MRPARVQLLVTCLVDRFFPGTGESVVRVLERAGVAVTVPEGQTCCGQPAFNAGYEPDARALARHTIDVLGASDDPESVRSGRELAHRARGCYRSATNYVRLRDGLLTLLS